MEVRFVSSLTSDEEEKYVPALLAVVSGLLDQTSLAYTLQIRTSGEKVFHHSHTASATSTTDDRNADLGAGTNGNGRRLGMPVLPPTRGS